MSVPFKQLNVVAIRTLIYSCHLAALNAGWWNNLKTGECVIKIDELTELNYLEPPSLVGEKLALIHSEISEAMEGHRKGLKDDKLPNRTMFEVELADAIIRICDLAGALDLDLAGAIQEKLDYNATRADHKVENRMLEGGKKY